MYESNVGSDDLYTWHIFIRHHTMHVNFFAINKLCRIFKYYADLIFRVQVCTTQMNVLSFCNHTAVFVCFHHSEVTKSSKIKFQFEEIELKQIENIGLNTRELNNISKSIQMNRA